MGFPGVLVYTYVEVYLKWKNVVSNNISGVVYDNYVQTSAEVWGLSRLILPPLRRLSEWLCA